MSDQNASVERERQLVIEAQSKGLGGKFATYAKLSGPGWLQSAITLGGGSLAGSLYLGVIGGYQMMWLQPLMMILGVIMLSGIAYVTLSTGERPFQAINKHINPVLGWGWIIATLMANMVWAMPQFSLGTAALEQNLGLGGDSAKYIGVAILFIAASIVIWFYDSGGRGVKIFEIILKIMVGIVVVSFFLVVIVMSTSSQGLPWGTILKGFIPDFSLLSEPADKFKEFLAQTANADFWNGQILSTQRDRMITAAATAVGINMTFLLPYSMLRKGWNRNYRGLASFDLSTGLFIPFVIATSCVVIASASQFHGQYDPGLVGEAEATKSTKALQGSYNKNADKLLKHQLGGEAFGALDDAGKTAAREALPPTDRKMAAMLVSRDAFHLANTLEDLTGPAVAQLIFGVGVLGMAVSTIIILMLINGFTICEMANQPDNRNLHRMGSMLPAFSGALGFLFLWGDADARFWLAVPTSVFGMVLLPIAYITFFLMMNNKGLLGDDLPQGGKKIAWNLAMLVAVAAALLGSCYAVWSKVKWTGVIIVGAFVLLAVVVHFTRPRPASPEA